MILVARLMSWGNSDRDIASSVGLRILREAYICADGVGITAI